MDKAMSKNKSDFFSKIAYYSFYLAVIIEVLIVIVDKSAYTNPIEGRLFQITFLLFFIKVCLTRYSKKEYLVMGLFLLLGTISYFVTGRNEIVRVVMFIAACKEVDVSKSLKLVFYLTLIGSVVIIILSVTGLYGALFLIQDYGRGQVEKRYVLGMGHPNALQCMVWALTSLGLYLYGEKMKKCQYLLVLLVNVAFFLLTASKTSFLVTVITIFGAYCLQHFPILKNSKLVEGIGLSGLIGCVFISILCAKNAILVSEYYWSRDFSLKARIYVFIDKFLTGRLQTLACTENMEGTIETWRLFSNMQSNYFFDLGWVRLFYWFGIIPAIVYIVANLILLHVCYKKEDYMGFLLILSVAVYTIFEAHVISDYMARNYIFFLMGRYWHQLFPCKKYEKDEKNSENIISK